MNSPSVTDWLNEWVIYNISVCKTAPATPGLLIISNCHMWLKTNPASLYCSSLDLCWSYTMTSSLTPQLWHYGRQQPWGAGQGLFFLLSGLCLPFLSGRGGGGGWQPGERRAQAGVVQGQTLHDHSLSPPIPMELAHRSRHPTFNWYVDGKYN